VYVSARLRPLLVALEDTRQKERAFVESKEYGHKLLQELKIPITLSKSLPPQTKKKPMAQRHSMDSSLLAASTSEDTSFMHTSTSSSTTTTRGTSETTGEEVDNTTSSSFVMELQSNKSSVFGLTEDQRSQLLNIFDQLEPKGKVRNVENSLIGGVYEHFWKIFFKVEPKAKLLNEAPLDKKAVPIAIIARFMRACLESPHHLIPTLQKNSLFHYVMGIGETEFATFAQSWTQAAVTVLGEKFPPQLQECMYSVIIKFGSIIVQGIPELEKGIKGGKVFKKEASKWTIKYIMLQKSNLLLFRDVGYTKLLKTINLEEIEEISKADEDGPSTAYGSVIQLKQTSSKKVVYLALEQKKMNDWLSRLNTVMRAISARRMYFDPL